MKNDKLEAEGKMAPPNHAWVVQEHGGALNALDGKGLMVLVAGMAESEVGLPPLPHPTLPPLRTLSPCSCYSALGGHCEKPAPTMPVAARRGHSLVLGPRRKGNPRKAGTRTGVLWVPFKQRLSPGGLNLANGFQLEGQGAGVRLCWASKEAQDPPPMQLLMGQGHPTPPPSLQVFSTLPSHTHKPGPLPSYQRNGYAVGRRRGPVPTMWPRPLFPLFPSS